MYFIVLWISYVFLCFSTFCFSFLSFDNFMQIISSNLDTHIPIRKVKKNNKKIPRLPWITKSILRSINRKNNFFIGINKILLSKPKQNMLTTRIYSQKPFEYKKRNTIRINLIYLSTIWKIHGKSLKKQWIHLKISLKFQKWNGVM